MASLTKRKVVCLISLIFIMGLPTDVRSISDDNDFGGGFFGSLESMANTVGGYLRSGMVTCLLPFAFQQIKDF